MNDRFIVISPLKVADDGDEQSFKDGARVAIRCSDILTFGDTIIGCSNRTVIVVRDVGNRQGFVRYEIKEDFDSLLEAINKEDSYEN